MHTHMHTHTHTMHTHMHTHTHTYTHYAHTYAHTYTHIVGNDFLSGSLLYPRFKDFRKTVIFEDKNKHIM